MRVGIASFTNISRDHLDYHGTIEAYFQAKMILFERLVHAGGAAVIAADNELAGEVAARARRRGLRVIEVGRSGRDVRLVDCAHRRIFAAAHHRPCRRHAPRAAAAGRRVSRSRMRWSRPGRRSPPAAIRQPCSPPSKGSPAPRAGSNWSGRKAGAPIFVDYAHKPDALAKALEALRPYVGRRLVVVFGAGGDRDAGKRPLMGAIAAEKADRVIVTDDNPRSEDPAAIRAAIMTAAPGAARRSAIATRRSAARWRSSSAATSC